MMNSIYDKTDKGRDELATRKNQLPSRLRNLLLLIDGKNSGEDLLKKFAGLSLNNEVLQQLRDQDYIVDVTPAAPPAIATSKPVDADTPNQSIFKVTIPEGGKQFQSLYNFFIETIKTNLGLRGYPMQLKVERADSIADFRALRTPFLEAIFKAKGEETARDMRDRLDQLLYLGEMPPVHTNPPKYNF